MMNSIQALSRTITRASLLMALVLCSAVSQVWAGSSCMRYFETLQTSGPTPLGPLSGIATVTIGGETKQAQFVTIALGPIKFAETGDITADFADLYIFPDGVMTAISKNTRTNIAQGTFTANTRFTGGTGRYANLRGRARLKGNGAFLPDGSTVTDSVTEGRICRSGSKNGNKHHKHHRGHHKHRQ